MAIAAGMPVAESQGGFVGSPQRPEPGSQGRSQQAVDVEGLRRRIMKEAEEAFQLELNRLNQAGGSYSDEASFRTAQSDPIPPPPPPPPPPRGIPPEDSALRTAANMTEALRNLELPALPLPGGDMASLQFGDWVTVINPLMSDIAGSARTWWRKVVEQAEQAYARWLVATILEKIRLLPELDLGPEHNFRVKQRGVSMLLAAVPDGIRRDIISSRRMSSINVMFRLYQIYQPGGQSERGTLLKNLADHKIGTSNAEALQTLRQWRRWLSRAEELGLALPDGLVLMAVLNKVGEVISKGNGQVGFRIASVRK